jgi:hypothetical protein
VRRVAVRGDACIGGWQRCTQNDDSALVLAAEKGHADCVQLLLDAEADKEAKNKVRVLAVSFWFCCLQVLTARPVSCSECVILLYLIQAINQIRLL